MCDSPKGSISCAECGILLCPCQLDADGLCPKCRDDKPSTYIPKPAKRVKNKGKKEYDAFRQLALASFFDRAEKSCMIHKTPEGDYLPVHCAICKEPGLIVRHKGVYHMSHDIGHIEGRGRRPDLKMELSNVRVECRRCNGRLTRGVDTA